MSSSEVRRLESLWTTEFGDDYVDRNRAAGDKRGAFWNELLLDMKVRNVLEVGCNMGANLRWVADHVPQQDIWGIDVNQKALRELRNSMPDINAFWTAARELPFRDGLFDLVFTMGVLIHQPERSLPLVMSEIVRCSRRYVLCGEYFSEQTTEVAYRGQTGALFKRDYGRIYEELFPQLKLRRKGFLGKPEGWDDVTYWLFEKG